MTRFLHIAKNEPMARVWIEPFCRALREMGQLEIISGGAALEPDEIARKIRSCTILLTCWQSVMIPVEVASDPGALQYVCNVSGSVRPFVPIEIVDAGIPVTNWGDAPALRIATGAVTLLLASLKNLPNRQRLIRNGEWDLGDDFPTAGADGLNVGVYGCGVIGRKFIELLTPFEPVIRVYDPYIAELPDGCIRVGSLAELFAASEAVAIHAGLSDETRGSVTAELLAMLPDGGVVVNTARGGIVDQDALFAEIGRGRLRAALDVLEPDTLPPDHPARQWDDLILTAHKIGRGGSIRLTGPRATARLHRYALQNIRRHLAGEPLRFLMDHDRYERST